MDEKNRAIKSGITRRNGLINGSGFTNSYGLINGNGITYGKGLINGNGIAHSNGLINGNGITNGNHLATNGPDWKQMKISVLEARLKRKAFFGVIIILITILIPIAVYYIGTDVIHGIKVDGKFSDWLDVVKTQDQLKDTSNANVDIAFFALNEDRGSLSFYVKVQGEMFEGDNSEKNQTDILNVFLDSDNDETTGYRTNGLGADYTVIIYGRLGKIHSSHLYVYDNRIDSDGLDWNGYRSVSSVRSATSGSELEFQINSRDIAWNENGRVIIYMRSFSGEEDSSDYIFGEAVAKLIIQQRSIGNQLIDKNSKTKVLSIDIEAVGDDVALEEITLIKVGNAELISVEVLGQRYNLSNDKAIIKFQKPLILKNGEIRALDVIPVLTQAVNGSTVGLEVDNIDDVKTDCAVTLTSSLTDYISYIGQIPDIVQIDGAFGDWQPENLTMDLDVDDENYNIDIQKYGQQTQNNSMSFYLGVDGTILGGLKVPGLNPRIISGKGGVNVGGPSEIKLPVVQGEDVIRIFLDIDNDTSTGFNPFYSDGRAASKMYNGLNSFNLGADHMLEIKGKNGQILEKGTYKFDGLIQFDWNWTKVTNLNLATDQSQLEAQVDLDQLGFDPNAISGIRIYFWLSDYLGKEDTGDLFFESKSNLDTVYESPPEKMSRRIKIEDNTVITIKDLTSDDLDELKQIDGIYQDGVDYNIMIDGHGTGLKPPSEDEWNEIRDDIYIIESVENPNVYMTRASSAVDHSVSEYFPPIGTQDGEGSCVAWAVGYYTKTFQEAKEHDWNLSGASWVGGYYGAPTTSYQDKIMSPDFIYHQINDGVDTGSYYSSAMDLCNLIGVCSWEKMPYDANTSITWPTEAAWREAPFYRTQTGYGYFRLYPLLSPNGISTLKTWIDSGHLGIISIDAYQYSSLSNNSGTTEDMWTNNTYSRRTTNHANTIVGYDDNFGPYIEDSTTRYGAFKVANSWLTNWTGDSDGDGMYWISYNALAWKLRTCMAFIDKIDYEPKFISVFNITHQKRGECNITVGMGNRTTPEDTKEFDDWTFDFDGGDHPFPNNNIVFDITEYLPGIYGKNYFIKVEDGGSGGASGTGTITNFTVEHYDNYTSGIPRVRGVASSKDTPVATQNNNIVYAEVVLPGYTHNIDTAEYFSTIQDAIDDTDTLDGHRIETTSGRFVENVDIDKMLNITGDYPFTAIDGKGTGDVVYIRADWVNLTGFTVNNSGNNSSKANAGIKLYNTGNSTIRNCSIGENYYGLYLDSSLACLIVNSSIKLSTKKDIGLNLSSGLTALNLSFDNVSVAMDDIYSNLTVQWFLSVSVNDMGGVPINNAMVVIEDNGNGTWSQTYLTDTTGELKWIITTEYIQNSSGRLYYSPYQITVTNETLNINNFANNPRIVLMWTNQDEIFMEIPELDRSLIPVLFLVVGIVIVKCLVYRKKEKRKY